MVTSEGLYLALLGLLAAERLFELWLSRRNVALELAKGAREFSAGHYAPMALLHALFLFSCAGELLWFRPPFSAPVGWTALAVAIAAQALRYWAVTALGSRWSTRVVAVPGAAPVTSGPYRFVRHPNYVAVALELAAVPLIHGCYRTALLFTLANAGLLAVRIRAEERALGEPYRVAFAGRPRFVPGAKRG